MLSQQDGSGPERDHLIEGNVISNYSYYCIGAYSNYAATDGIPFFPSTVGDIEGVSIRGNKCLNQVDSRATTACILVESAHNATVTDNECGKIIDNHTGIVVSSSDQVNLANNRIDARGATSSYCIDVEDATNAVASGNVATGCTGASSVGIRVAASVGAGSTNQVTLTGNQAYGNTTNYAM